jgi:hypothetical protein
METIARHCELSEAIHNFYPRGKLDCVVALLLAMTESLPYPETRSNTSRTSPLNRSSLYPVIGNGLAPVLACFAASAMFAAFAGLPFKTASDAESRSGIGAIPPAVMRMNWKLPPVTTARTHTSTSGHSVEGALVFHRWRHLDRLDHFAR